MTKLAVLTDLHANLPALRAALAAIEREGYDLVVHTGDAIAIGPHPAECLDLLLNTPNVVCLKGNHETWLVDGLPQPRPDWMTDGEVAHQHWTHAQIDAGTRAAIDSWPYRLALGLGGVRVTFVHYGLTESGQDFVPVVRPPTAEGLDLAFADEPTAVVFNGHDHRASDIEGRALPGLRGSAYARARLSLRCVLWRALGLTPAGAAMHPGSASAEQPRSARSRAEGPG